MLFASLVVVTVAAAAAATTVRGACEAADLTEVRAVLAAVNSDCTCGEGQQETTHTFSVNKFTATAAVQAFCPAATDGGERKRALAEVAETEAECKTLFENLRTQQQTAKTTLETASKTFRDSVAGSGLTAQQVQTLREALELAKAAVDTQVEAFKTSNAAALTACETATQAARDSFRTALEAHADNVAAAAAAARPQLEAQAAALKEAAGVARATCAAQKAECEAAVKAAAADAEAGICATQRATCAEAVTAVKSEAGTARDAYAAALVELREATGASAATLRAEAQALATAAQQARADWVAQLRANVAQCTEDNTCAAKVVEFKAQFAETLEQSENLDRLRASVCAKASVAANAACLRHAQSVRGLSTASIGAVRAGGLCIKLDEKSVDDEGNVVATVSSCKVAPAAATTDRKRDPVPVPDAPDAAIVQAQLTDAGFTVDTTTALTIDGENTSTATTTVVATAALALCAAAVAALL